MSYILSLFYYFHLFAFVWNCSIVHISTAAGRSPVKRSELHWPVWKGAVQIMFDWFTDWIIWISTPVKNVFLWSRSRGSSVSSKCFLTVSSDLLSLPLSRYCFNNIFPPRIVHFSNLAKAPLVVVWLWTCHLCFFLLLCLLNVAARLSALIWNESVALSPVFTAGACGHTLAWIPPTWSCHLFLWIALLFPLCR